MRYGRARRRGVTLIETLISFALITITLSVVSGSILLAHRTIDRVRVQDSNVAAARRLARQFRFDVARARAVRVDGEGTTCELQLDQHQIHYGGTAEALHRTMTEENQAAHRERYFTRTATWKFMQHHDEQLVSVKIVLENGLAFEAVAAHTPADGMKESNQ